MVDKKAIRGVVSLIAFTAIILVLLIAGNNSLISLLSVYIGMLVVSIFIFNTKQFQKNLIGLSKKNLVKSLVWAAMLGAAFWLITRLFPGFSIGLPRVSLSIGETIRNIVILFFAPVVESIFQVVMFAVLRGFTSVRTAVFGQAGLFSFAHIAAYVSGFYNYPSFTAGLSALSANMGAFIAAFLFALAGFIVLLQPKIRNIAFLIVFHFILNLVILTSLSLIFIG